jgi:N-methylhydantoinase A
VWELEVPLTSGRFESDDDVGVMIDAFHVVHERVFAVSEPGQYIECIYWKGRATAELPKPALREIAVADSVAEPNSWKPAWFGGGEPLRTPRYLGHLLLAGQTIAGQAIIEEPTTTVVVYPGWSATVTTSGDYLMTRGELQ